MTPIAKAAIADVPVLLGTVAIQLDPTEVLAWVAAAFFGLLAFFVQREWAAHDRKHEAVEARLKAIEDWCLQHRAENKR